METFYWSPDDADETARMDALFHERVDEAEFVAFHIAIDPKSGKPNGYKGDRMETFEPTAGGMIFVRASKL